LEFDFTPELKRSLFYAEVELSDLITQNETCVLEFEEFGKRFITSNKMSPDAFVRVEISRKITSLASLTSLNKQVQLAMMAAYFRLHGRAVSVYESVQTKHFFHGRTAAARPMTSEAKALCERLVQLWDTRHRSESSLSAARSGTLDTTDEAVESRNRRVQLRKQLRDAILVAAKAHVREVKAAAKGQDVDRHLYALLCLARTNGENVPDLFQTEAWQRLNHTVLSTSNCGNPSLRLFGFGPVSPDGYGLGYIIKDGALSFCAASKNRQTSRYLGMLKKTLRLFRSVLASPEVSTPKRIRKKTIMMSAGYGFFDSGKIEDDGSEY
jgi:carnitine O-acetyltransferase